MSHWNNYNIAEEEFSKRYGKNSWITAEMLRRVKLECEESDKEVELK